MIAPKKSLGQNFLKDKNICRKIAGVPGAAPGDRIIEIGPGTGALTEFLLKTGAEVISIEIDDRAYSILEEKFATAGNFELIRGNFLDLDLNRFASPGKRLILAGNIPYYITSEICFRYFENAGLFESAIFTMQKEVAQRLAAVPGNKSYGILTVARELVSSSKINFDIPPGAFYPPPKVTSSVLLLKTKENKISGREFVEVMQIVRAAFSQRRKMLGNSLDNFLRNTKSVDTRQFIKFALANNVDFAKKRAEQLTTEDYITMASLLKKAEKVPEIKVRK